MVFCKGENKSIKKTIISICCTLIYSFAAFNTAAGQDTTIVNNLVDNGIYRILWINQYPTPKDQNTPNLAKRIFDFFFSKSTLELSKPMALIAKNPGTLWVLDQGTGMIFYTNDQLDDITQFFDKSNEDFGSLVGMCFAPDNKILRKVKRRDFCNSCLSFLYTAKMKSTILIQIVINFAIPAPI